MKEILTDNQLTVLDEIKNSKFITENFYLTGGTALAAFYLGHRYSEDLDFFSEEEFDMLNLNVFFNQLKQKLKINQIDFQQSYNRNLFFLSFGEETLKVEFTFFPFLRLDKSGKGDGLLAIDSILDIGINKLFTIYQRTKARDFIDLYCICLDKGYSVGDLAKKARIKFDWHIDPIQLGTQFIKVVEAKDYPKMIKDLSPGKWQDFFMQEAKKLKTDILD